MRQTGLAGVCFSGGRGCLQPIAPPQKQTTEARCFGCCFQGDPAGARTQDPNIKSVVLYLLSYEINAKKVGRIRFGGANVAFIFVLAK